MVTAAALGDALGVPVHGVCSLDAIAHGARLPVVVVTDARRREVYWAAYDADGPAPTARTSTRPPRWSSGSPDVPRRGGREHAEVIGLPVSGRAAPDAGRPRRRRRRGRCAPASCPARWSRSTCAVPTPRSPVRASG